MHQGYTGVFFDGRDEDALFCLSGGSYQTYQHGKLPLEKPKKKSTTPGDNGL